MMDRAKTGLIEQCAGHLGLTLAETISISSTAPKRYFVWKIKKRSGGDRIVCHPARELKPIQEYFLHHVLRDLPVHPAATAYVKGSSIKKNALEHVFSRVILKLDFKDFFNSINVDNWIVFSRDHFPHWSLEEVNFSARILFWGNKTYIPKCLAIGSPTSPQISNAIMFEVDEILYLYAASLGMVYTRYADDITFSSKGEIDKVGTIAAVRQALNQARYSTIQLNETKTKLASNSSHRRVTGLVLTPDCKISLGRDRKRTISAMCHQYLHKRPNAEELPRLSGLLAFAQDVEPAFVHSLRQKYGTDAIELIIKGKTQSGS